MRYDPAEPSPSERIGPLPAAVATVAGPTRAQAAVLGTLASLGRPATLLELAGATALHVNTLREHLTALESAGRVARGSAAPKGRGRPAVTFTAVAPEPDPTAVDYLGLAGALAAMLQRTSRRRAAEARVAGREWGARLARSVEAPCRSSSGRRGAAVDLLDRLGFSPSADDRARTVHLTRCPLLDVAQQYPDVVCSIHRGVVEGALRHWGDEHTGVELTPFAEPGACLLRMGTDRESLP